MTHMEFAKGWERLRAVYGTMPRLSADVEREWYAVLGSFSAEAYDKAIDWWIAQERYKPSPSELAARCRQAHQIQLATERAAAQSRGDICKWCNGFGYVRLENEPDDRDTFTSCICSYSPDPKHSVVMAVANDPTRVFNEDAHSFQRRQTWIDDDDSQTEAKDGGDTD